jgi:hypothetical protein
VKWSSLFFPEHNTPGSLCVLALREKNKGPVVLVATVVVVNIQGGLLLICLVVVVLVKVGNIAAEVVKVSLVVLEVIVMPVPASPL